MPMLYWKLSRATTFSDRNYALTYMILIFIYSIDHVWADNHCEDNINEIRINIISNNYIASTTRCTLFDIIITDIRANETFYIVFFLREQMSIPVMTWTSPTFIHNNFLNMLIVINNFVSIINKRRIWFIHELFMNYLVLDIFVVNVRITRTN